MIEFYRVQTCHGSEVASDPSNGLLVHAAPDALRTRCTPIIAGYFPGLPHNCFVARQSEEVSRIGCWPDPYHAEILPFRLYDLGPGRAALASPSSWKFVSAHPAQGGDVGRIEADAVDPVGQQALRLFPVSNVFVPVKMMSAVGLLCRILAAQSRVEEILATIYNYDPVLMRLALNAALPLLTDRELDDFAERCLEDLRLTKRVAEVLAGDLWASSLVELANFFNSKSGKILSSPEDKRGRFSRFLGFQGIKRAEARSNMSALHTGRQSVSIEYSSLATAGYSGNLQSFGHACATRSRRRVKPRQRVCIVATARNEGIYLLDWIAYHLCLGVEHFFIYTNDNEDGSEQLLAALSRSGVVTLLENTIVSGGDAQHKAYGHAFSILPEVLDYEWSFVIDVDEFFVFNPAIISSLNDFLSWHENRSVDAIALNWVMIGSSSGRWEDSPLHERCTRQFGPDAHVKTIFRPHKAIHSGAHFPVADARSSLVACAANGQAHSYANSDPVNPFPALSDFPDDGHACLYHYFFKSAEEYMWKFSRNRGDFPLQAGVSTNSLSNHFLKAFMNQHQSSSYKTDNRVNHCAVGFSKEIGRLRALPGVSEAERLLKARFIERSAQVMSAFAESPTLLEAGDLGREFLELASKTSS